MSLTPGRSQSTARPSTADKRRAFRQLHETGCFAIPNPWDIGSAIYLQSLGFKALASTSSGFAWSRGRADNTPTRREILDHIAEMAAATDVPLNADFENGFGADAAGVAESVRLAAETGIAGLSIEDSVGPRLQRTHGAGATPDAPLFDLEAAVERVRAARSAIDRSGVDMMLIGRAECFLVGQPNIDETIARLVAYSDAGADCLYAPGIQNPEHIRRVVEAVHPKPVNVLVMAPATQSMRQLAELGVRRVSVGGALARAAWGGFMHAAREIAEQGRFDALANAASGRSLNALFE
ncbi:MAG: isocitrate lyase/phosphoenolpyruvate mutase family protein [Steroidobacteraceae bacterium]